MSVGKEYLVVKRKNIPINAEMELEYADLKFSSQDQ